MNLTEIEFAFFLPAAFLVYWALPRRIRWQNAALLLAGYVFYFTWNPRLLWVIAVATAVDYAVGRYIDAHRGDRRRMRAGVAVSVVYNVLQLGYFKYVGFFAASLNAMLDAVGLAPSLPVLEVALPIGLSYYTLQKLSYIIDVYHGRIEVCRSPLTFATFVAFFPQLTAGPIVRGGQLIPQLSVARRLDPNVLRAGAGAFLLGFVMKSYVGDWIGQNLVHPVFADPAAYSVLGHWMGLLGFTVQIFCDFAGYSVMAIGVGRLFGVELPVNFNYPFFSKSLMELWRRWHITLNAWLFDYLYGPLTTSRGWFRGRLDLGFLVVFLISGLWHGAAWGFVIWGGLHGVGLIVQRRWDVFYRGRCKKNRVWVKRRRTRGYAVSAWAITQIFFVLTMVPFAVSGLADIGSFLAGLFAAHGTALPGVANFQEKFNLLVCVGLFLGYHVVEMGRLRRLRDGFFKLPAPARGVAYGALIVFLCVFVPKAAGTFVYANF